MATIAYETSSERMASARTTNTLRNGNVPTTFATKRNLLD